MPASWRNKPVFLLLWLLPALLLPACNRSGTGSAAGHQEHGAGGAGTATGQQEYTCPMHPEIVSSQPGECPICHMNLEPKDKVLEQLTADPNRFVISAQTTVKASRTTTTDSVTLQGFIAPDERRINVVSAYYPGRIEELFVRFDYTYVKKGQPVLSIYSPELATAQEEFLFLLQENDTLLLAQARKRLLLLGMTNAQLNTLARTRKPQLKLTVFSPYEGYLQFPESGGTGADRPASAGGGAMAAGSGMSGMGASGTATQPGSQQQAAPATNALRQGQYVAKGQALFQVNDLRKVWAVLAVPATLAGDISEGSRVSLRSPSLPGQTISGTVNFVEPVLREGQRQSSVRVYLDNPSGKLKPNALVQATFHPGAGSNALVVPSSAVWSLGRRNIVWVRRTPAGAHSFLFEAKEVNIGARRGNVTEITSGLPENAWIAKEAGFMTDSEAFIRPE